MNTNTVQLDYYLCEIVSFHPLVKSNHIDKERAINVQLTFSKKDSSGYIKIDSWINLDIRTNFHAEYRILESGNLSEENSIVILTEIVYQHISRHYQLLTDIKTEHKCICVPCMNVILEEINKNINIGIGKDINFTIQLGNLL